MPFWVPPLGGADCPCDPCLIVNVASKEQINRTVLQTSMNVLLFLRTTVDMQETQSDDWPTVEQPPRAYAQLKLEDVWWSDERRLVAVCVTLDDSHRSTVSIRTIRRVLIDLTVSGWLSKSLDTEKQDGKLVRRPSNDLMQEIVNFVQRYDQVVSVRVKNIAFSFPRLVFNSIVLCIPQLLYYDHMSQKFPHFNYLRSTWHVDSLGQKLTTFDTSRGSQ
ncbi:hypothetical protein FBUS_08545 [Fasciolopsis buskii]|uniref:Uncharacterized protein n=1 Tax=Fasciolopsis buskii TaxID=27845 RepID=A0A8E0VIA8_9TREM|nr:hypothetical protein FBUS_08545 [Fasciolopsis buski]